MTICNNQISNDITIIPSLQGKNFISISELSEFELRSLIQKASEYKKIYKENLDHEYQPLVGENISMIFQKRSTRTRISTEVGMQKLGGHALFLSFQDIQLGVNESLKDSAMVLSRFNSLILARVHSHKDILELANESRVPVINGLSDKFHPLQALADILTLQEHFGDLTAKTIAWVGDGNNVLHDLMISAVKLGMNINIATPKGYEPAQDVLELSRKIAMQNKNTIFMTNDPMKAVRGANVIVTDTWISMGQESEAIKRKKDFTGYQINKAMLENNASNDYVFLHCLPRHPEEVSDDVFYSDKSLVYDEAENRMWTVMAVMSAVLGK